MTVSSTSPSASGAGPSNSELLKLRQVHVSGDPRALGRGQGEALRPVIVAFVEQRLQALRAYMEERKAGSVEAFLALGAECLRIAQAWDPAGTSEHLGIAEGAGVDATSLYAVANMTDVRDVLLLPPPLEDEGCTSFVLPKHLSADGLVVAGQTWDLNPDDLDYVVAIHRRPSEGPETWSVTCAGCLSLVGMNEHGLAVGTTNIKARATQPGVGYMSLLHRAIRERTRELAAESIRSAPRAAAHTYWIADAGGGLEIEATARHAVVRRADEVALARTNHCIAPEVLALQGEATTSSSLARLARATKVLSQGKHDLESLRALFADRTDGVDSINRYPEDAQGTTTNSCVLAWPERRLLWACRGPADRGEWVVLPFGS